MTESESHDPAPETSRSKRCRLLWYAGGALAACVAVAGFTFYSHHRAITDGRAELARADSWMRSGQFQRALTLAQRIFDRSEADELRNKAMAIIVVAQDEIAKKADIAREGQRREAELVAEARANSLRVRIATAPPGASVTRAGKLIGNTPLTVDARRDRALRLDISLDGHELVHFAEKPSRDSYALVLERTPAWRHELPGAVTDPGTVDGSTVLITDRSGQLSVIDLATGKVLHRKSARGLAAMGTPIVYKDAFIVADRRGTVRAFAKKSGRTTWTLELKGPLITTPVGIGDTILLAGEDGTVSAVHREGEVIKSTRIARRIVARPASDGKRFGYVIDTDGRCHAVDDTGRPLWNVEVENAGRLAPVAGGGRLVVPADDGRLHAFDAGNGEHLWTASLGSAATATPAIISDELYVVTARPELIELRPRDGARLRSIALPGAPSAGITKLREVLAVPVAGHGAYLVSLERFELAGHIADGMTTETPVLVRDERELIFATDTGALLGFRF